MSASTFVHVGDLHLSPGPRQADRLKALDQIIAEGEVIETLAAWLIPGDIFDRKSTIEDRNAFTIRVLRMANKAPVLLAYGNHDAPGDLDIYREMAADYPVYVFDRPQVIRIPLERQSDGYELKHASIFVLPYPTESGLVSAGVSPSEIPQVAREALVDIFRDAAEKLTSAARQLGDLVMMIGHVNVSGAVSSVGQPSVGKEIELDQSLLEMLPDCPKLLSHIHKAQEIGGAWYAGSVCRLNFGETEPKSYLRATFMPLDTDGLGNAIPWVLTRHSIDVPPMYHVEGTLSARGFLDAHATAGPDGPQMFMPQSWKGCDVRVRAKYLQSEGSILEAATKHVKALFAEARTFEFEPVCVPDRALRAPEVTLAKTLAEKVEAWARVAGVELSSLVAEKLDLLERPDSDAVVASVQEQMQRLVKQDSSAASQRAESSLCR